MSRWILLLSLVLATAAQAMTLEEAQSSLSGEQGLVLKTMAPIRGRALLIDGGQLVFRSQRGGGSLEYRYGLDEIERLQFPGNDVALAATDYLEAGDAKNALPLFEVIYLQRAPFLEILTPGEHEFFARYAELEFQHGNPYAGLGVGMALLPHIEDARLKRKVEDLVLLGHYRLPMKQDSRELALDWVANSEPYGPSALGYYVLGRLDFDEENYEAALWRALEPIALSSQFPMDYLDYCYALAIAACVELEYEAEEKKLRLEMAERGLAWPDLDGLTNYRPPAQPSTETPPS